MATTVPKGGQRGGRTPLTPFTLPHFRAYTSKIVLDTGEFWFLEDFQAEVVQPILDGVTETWAILPEGNAKTTLMAGVGLYHCDFTYAPWVPIGASARDQAEILALQAMDMVRRSPGFLRRFRPYEGYRKIVHLQNGGRGIKVYAADANTGDGVIPTLALCDELHRWPDLRLYRLWKGKLNKRGGQIVGISTAGEPGGEFEEQRDAIRAVAPTKTRNKAHLRSEGANITMNEWQVESAGLISDMEAVKAANPLASITIRALREDFESPTTDLGDWKRLKCNIPARSSITAITEAEWDDALVDDNLQDGDYIDLGVDIAWKHDTTAIVPILATEEYRLIADPYVLVPPRDGSMLDPQDVKDALEFFCDTYVVNTVVMDMHQGADIASWLEHEKGVTVIAWAQGNAQAAEDYQEFMKALRSKTPGERLVHNGNATMRKHVMNAIARSLPSDKRRFDRPSQGRAKRKQETRVIDALMAASWVNSFLANPPEPEWQLAGSVEDYRVSALLD
jgi:phage terminase large subunit-like protein